MPLRRTSAPSNRSGFQLLSNLTSHRPADAFSPPSLADHHTPTFNLIIDRPACRHITEGEYNGRPYCDFHLFSATIQMSQPEDEPNIYDKATGDFCLRAYLDEDYEVKVEEDESRGSMPELDKEILDPFYVPNAPSSTTPQSSPPVGPVPPPENNTIAPPVSGLSRTCPALLPELPPSVDPAIPPHTTVLPVRDFDPLAYITSIDNIIQPLVDNIIKHFAGEAYHFPNLLVQYNQIRRQIFRWIAFLKQFQEGITIVVLDLYEGALSLANAMCDLHLTNLYYYSIRDRPNTVPLIIAKEKAKEKERNRMWRQRMGEEEETAGNRKGNGDVAA
ncbi:hypothetical protein JAAARDRAFT_686280 [Jaapia argillacea MUCL 33604]|uniref:Uncharacterized protein n=1 Tax=Jaapia argillacea MUCL 33604 TaxID=933084 RepID=A0A067PTW2_9AGAM|nr:hypothetical protein JAAARDRAFT_686280 [Jaapia argillacea MUCL 33604]